MKCPKCNSTIPNDSQYCPDCGAEIEREEDLRKEASNIASSYKKGYDYYVDRGVLPHFSQWLNLTAYKLIISKETDIKLKHEEIIRLEEKQKAYPPFSVNNYHLQINKQRIIEYYRDGKDFVARKFFVDEFGCTWSQATKYLKQFLEYNNIPVENTLNQNQTVRPYYPHDLEMNRNKITRLYAEGSSFAARKYFVDYYHCTWEQAMVYLVRFVEQKVPCR